LFLLLLLLMLLSIQGFAVGALSSPSRAEPR